jgi:hypothetical protein
MHILGKKYNATFQKRSLSVLSLIEHCFGVLQARFQTIANPNHQWNREVIANVLIACVSFHNMIIDNEVVVDNRELAFEG